ncbi:aminoacyl-tRNA hydrolase [Candidatus Kaiserbacteria bacterium CG10_big_fil_rev_8_21_14_0_10_45_20]|uniref:Peptidyl-tRNA hydrolase n=1 Tax=Candidatus Kaiserbacteria bacterium CG10_big_fil_rev_8_21_14_0_10_45_20 TaxID=1974607 RepID=A0A2H0UFX1_9BACT|nr:MAG: aminoacyl-tRNA hydrolase [Candidatus Kaiserbacteria bacterium CG10_big_fil_rev_8_21_14_0_10_45_20]
MYTIVGLGNPGGEYVHTRHNAGRILVESLATQEGVALKDKKKPAHLVGTGDVYGVRARLVLPNTFMNKSGTAVVGYVKTPKAGKNLIVVYDDIDLPLGVVRVSFGRGSGGHRGIESITRAIKTKDFIRIRVGVSKSARGRAKKPSGEKEVVDFLMGTFPKSQYEMLTGEIQEKVFRAIELILPEKSHVPAMNVVNRM